MDRSEMDWNPAQYAQFSDLRLRPVMDLLAAVHEVPAGTIIDLGCGAGTVAPVLKARFPERRLYGVDNSFSMSEKARERGIYTEVECADITTYDPGYGAALLFSNAALNWVPDHAVLLPRLVQVLAPGGWLAVQVPYQHDAPSHALARQIAHQLAPEVFVDARAKPHVLTLQAYADLLEPLGETRVWRTEYMQRLKAEAAGHPIRHFTQSTYLRPYLEHFTQRGQVSDFLAAYDAALQKAYPLDAQGRAWFPFNRLFLTLQKA